MKRCKNCQLWRPYKGNEPTLPSRSSNACMLRLRETNFEGKTIVVPSLSELSEKASTWGVRTGPNFVCSHFVGKPPPFVKPKDQK